MNILIFSLLAGLVFGTARVTSLSVNRIGLGGGMITINGEGFATDAFSQFDPSKGNKVSGKMPSVSDKLQIIYS